MAGQLAQAKEDNAALRVHLDRGAVSLRDFAWARQLIGEGLRQLTQSRALYRPETACSMPRLLRNGSVRY